MDGNRPSETAPSRSHCREAFDFSPVPPPSSPPVAQIRVYYYLLCHSRECFTHLFSSIETRMLILLFFLMNGAFFVLFLALDWGGVLGALSVPQKVSGRRGCERYKGDGVRSRGGGGVGERPLFGTSPPAFGAAIGDPHSLHESRRFNADWALAHRRRHHRVEEGGGQAWSKRLG